MQTSTEEQKRVGDTKTIVICQQTEVLIHEYLIYYSPGVTFSFSYNLPCFFVRFYQKSYE